MIRPAGILALSLAAATPAAAAEPALAFRVGETTLAVPPFAARAVPAADASGQGIIIITLADGVARAFGKLTGDNVGKVLEIVICGAVALSPRLEKPIYGNEVHVSGGIDMATATELSRRISAGDCAGFTSPFKP